MRFKHIIKLNEFEDKNVDLVLTGERVLSANKKIKP